MSRPNLPARLALVLATLLALPFAARATDLPHASPRLTQACADCHVLHNAPGLALTNVAGQFNLCSSCHVANSQAAWNAADQAIPGTSGSSHSWSGLVVSPGNGSAMPTSPDLLEHLDTAFGGAKKIRCGTCHDPHSQARAPFDPTAPVAAGAAGRHFGRLTNTANELCLDCHAARNMTDVGHGFWTGAKLSHPVRTSIPASTEFNAIPLDTTGTAQLLANFGTSTAGTTTTLTDSTKAWAGLNGQWIRFTSGSNKNLTRQITATAPTQVTFAAVPVAIGAGVSYEIDQDGNLLNNLVLSNAGVPSFTTGTVQCLTCHAVHYADSNSATYDDTPRAGDGNLLRRTNDDGACSACHTVKLHNSTVTNSSRPAWGTTFTCRTCHTAHDTANILLVNESIVTPNSGTHTVDFRSMSDVNGIEPFGLVNSTTPGTGPCETCHTNTRNGGAISTPGTATFTNAGLTVTGVGTTWSSQLAAGWEIRCTQGGGSASAWTKIATVNSNTQLTLVAGGYRGVNCAAGSTWEAANPRFRNTGSGRGAAGTEHYAGACMTCHTHTGGFRGGESSGNTGCSNCHDFDMTVDDGAKTGKYHHVMETDLKITAGLTTYPTTAAPTIATADQDKSCVQCHADHNIFRPDLNASNSQGRGANLRTRIANGPPVGAPPAASAPGDAAPGYYANRDYAFADAAGGICLSCHTTAQTKNQADQRSDGSTVTPALTKAGFDASIHDYTVAGRITNGASAFTTACTKCHNDGLTKSYQDGTYKFSLHASDERHLLSPMGIVAPPDPLEEKFCYRCHSAVADVNPGGGPAKGVTLRDYYNQTAMTARAEGIFAAMGKGTGATPAGPISTTAVLHFKPNAQEVVAEPMPNAHQTGDAFNGGTWIGRSMSPWPATAAYETENVTTNVNGTGLWRMATFTSPVVAAPANVPAGNWGLTLYRREANSAQNAFVRYMIYKWNANDTLGTTIVAAGNFATELPTTAAPGGAAAISVAGVAVSLAAGDRISIDVEIRTTATVNTAYVASYYFGSGAPSSLTMPGAVSFTYAAPAIAASGRHDVAAYSGLHKPSRTDETLAYIAANKHVECADCHDPHGAGNTTHTNGTNLVSGALSNVSGVTLTAAAANWTAPAMGAALTTATKEYEICMKCHSSANTSLAAWNSTWTNVALEFNTTNGSYHPVVAALPAADPGANGSSRLTAAQLTNGWTPGQTMYCSDCHGNNSAAPAAQGPHGSAANFMLKGPNTGWPLNSGGTLARGTSRAGVFCDNCHPANNNSHEAHSKSDHTALACINCHLLIPHGGKLDRLIGDADGTMPTRYAYQGNMTNMYIAGFTKTTPANYAKSNCGTTNASGCTGDHATANGADW